MVFHLSDWIFLLAGTVLQSFACLKFKNWPAIPALMAFCIVRDLTEIAVHTNYSLYFDVFWFSRQIVLIWLVWTASTMLRRDALGPFLRISLTVVAVLVCLAHSPLKSTYSELKYAEFVNYALALFILGAGFVLDLVKKGPILPLVVLLAAQMVSALWAILTGQSTALVWVGSLAVLLLASRDSQSALHT
jgi:hypothetical protein